jgi:UDP-N-acetylmuramoyl-L-alanyl-D-glutamate--2,6-diaminopimelate ligase
MMALCMTREDSESRAAGMTLAELARELVTLGPSVSGDATTRVLGVHQDSRAVEANDLFVARAGASADGARFAADAVRRGAVAVLAEQGAELGALSVPVLSVRDVVSGLAFAAEAVYGFPSRKVGLVGITGTNGKTTTACLVQQALLAAGKRAALLGTLGFSFDGEQDEGTHTTPGADDISRRLAAVAARGGSHFVMEVSSHALELGRVAALGFEVAAFSNLTQDHLDFHGSMAAYGAAKARLFEELSPRASVINVDDAFGRELAGRVRGRVLSVSRKAAASVAVQREQLNLQGIFAQIQIGQQTYPLQSRLVGAHNLENLLLALGILLALGLEPALALTALSSAAGAPGRLERCDQAGDQRLVVVDYAHTPDALERVLDGLRPLTPGKLWCVFGCGGDRDPGKRPLMGKAVAARADRAVVTNDNPRTEKAEDIAAAIVPPLSESGIEYSVELDRAAAIRRALLGSEPGDTVLIAGKGHENYQIFGHEKRPFDDRVEARAALAELREASR